jgi:hypothetical protein
MNTVPFRAALLSGLLLACGPAAFSQPLTFNTLAGYAGQGSADGLSAGHHLGLAWHEDQGSVTAR